MVGVAVLTDFASAPHRIGMPETRIRDVRAAKEGGKYVVFCMVSRLNPNLVPYASIGWALTR